VPDDIEQMPTEDPTPTPDNADADANEVMDLGDDDAIVLDDDEMITLDGIDDGPATPTTNKVEPPPYDDFDEAVPKPKPVPAQATPSSAGVLAKNPAVDFGVVKQKAMDPQTAAQLRKTAQTYKWDASQRKTANYYTTTGFTGMNDILRKGSGGDAKDVAAIKKLSEMIDNAPPIDPPVRVFRGMVLLETEIGSFIEGIKRNAETNTPATLDGFQSTTIRPEAAQKFDGAIYKMNIDTSVRFQIQARKGVYLESVSDFEDENELLLPHGNKYAVGEIVKDEYGYTISMVQLP
jgi:hypothetical protein